ncbi:C2 domain-containing protein 3 [Oopsacas minuta]|uniref:C2 domain-containing protein 3 n=1 Tax=Oopsacas minuta TaxID=111878 RepID=A0AAV7JTH0_9METZ|nr:C2 domain-containing protein 3 [Oopsacas minuta]
MEAILLPKHTKPLASPWLPTYSKAESEQNFSTQHTDSPNCGQLDLTIRYKLVKLDPEYSPTDPTIQPSKYHPQVYVKLQIKQATGLRDAVELASLSNKDISLSELETGVNTYVTIRFSFTKKTHTTKAIAATFSPTYSYEIELPLSLSQSVIDNHSPVSLAEIISKSTVNFQIWHVPLADRKSQQNRNHTQQPHVILGECSLPFEMLLLKSTGVKGWYSLKPPNGKGGKCVGALDLNVEFSSIEDREKVLYEANKFGFQIDRPVKFDSLQLESEQNLEIDINIRRLWISKHSIKGNNLYYLRYRFYDKTTTISPTFFPSRTEGNRMVFNTDYKKSSQVFPSSAFEWYLQEERFELQIWQTNGKTTLPVIPCVEDNLLGTAYVNLYEMCGFREFQEPQIAGVYPLFKPGVISLGGNCAEIEISIHQPTEIELLENTNNKTLEETEIQESESTLQTELPTGIPIILAIDRAAHLSCLPSQSGCLHVTVHAETLLFQTVKIKISYSPVWNFQQEVYINEEIFSPMLGLEVKIWYSSEIDTIQSQLVGVAKVDLSPLKYGLPELAGWYNLSNVMSSCQGQIKLRAIPRERMEIPSSVKVQHQRTEWGHCEKACSLIDNPVNTRDPIVIQEIDIDLTCVDTNITGSFLMRRLKSSLADLENVQANFKQNIQSKTPEAIHMIEIPPIENESVIDLCSTDSIILADTYPTMDNVTELLEEIDELPVVIQSPQTSRTNSFCSQLSELEPIQQHTEDIGVNTTTSAFCEDVITESSELSFIQEITISRNLSPALSEECELTSQEPQMVIEDNPHYILETNNEQLPSSPNPRSLTDISSISEQFEQEITQEQPDEDLLNWVDSVTKHVPMQDNEIITNRVISTDENGNLKINIPEDLHVPNYFMPPDTLLENMRNLRMKAMSQFPQAPPKEDNNPPNNPTGKPSVHLTTPLLPWEANRINKIFLGKV